MKKFKIRNKEAWQSFRRYTDRVVLTLNECGIESRPQLLASLHDLSGVLEVTDYPDNS